MILCRVCEEINNLLHFSFALMKSCYIFKLDIDIFCHLKVFCFVKLPSKLLSDILRFRAFVDQAEDDDKRNDV